MTPVLPDPPAGVERPPRPALAAGLVLLVVGLLGGLAGVAWLLPSMGPTLALQVRSPGARAAQPQRAILGHLVGLGCGAAAKILVNTLPADTLAAHTAHGAHLDTAAGALALGTTLALTHRLDADHPPAAATTLIVALGLVPATAPALLRAAGALCVVVVLGELLRRRALK